MKDLLEISNCSEINRIGDVVFVHGLDGDSKTTWHHKDNHENYWPKWVGEDHPSIGVWSLSYKVNSSAWKGSTMPLTERALNVLSCFETMGIGTKGIVFICHSLGGLLVKQILRHANDNKNPAWKGLHNNTKGVVFLSTPHSGSEIANWINYIGILLRSNITLRELEAHNPQLLDLNRWYREHIEGLGIKHIVYYEKETTAGLLVVNSASADPAIPGVTPIPVDVDHINICKPSRNSLIYLSIKRFIDDIFPPEEKSNVNYSTLKNTYKHSPNPLMTKSDTTTFELFLNGIKVEHSKGFTGNTAAVFSILSSIPEWKDSACTIEARLSRTDDRMIQLLEEICAEKLYELDYPKVGVSNFSLVFIELTQNALEHGASDKADCIRIQIEFSRTYTSIAVQNPEDRIVNLRDWINKSIDHMEATRKRDRGRGLILAARKADKLEQIGDLSIRAIIYRELVTIKRHSHGNLTILVVFSGRSNPSLGRRLQQAIRSTRSDKLIVCLSPEAVMSEDFLKTLEDSHEPSALSLSKAIKNHKLRIEEKKRPTEFDISDLLDTKAMKIAVKSMEKFVAERPGIKNDKKNNLVRLVCNDQDIVDLFPSNFTSSTIDEAYKELKPED